MNHPHEQNALLLYYFEQSIEVTLFSILAFDYNSP